VVEHPYFKPDEWKELYQACRSLAFSVVINPLDEKDEFCHCKSELKYVETGAMMVPLVTSRVHPFTEVIREGENGFFASTPEEFADKALMVCRNPSLAEKVAMAAHKHVKEEYDSVRNARRFMADVMVSMAAEEDDEALFLRQEASKLVDALGSLERFDQEVVGPVKGGSLIEQTVLLLPTCEISGISVLGATYCKTVRRGAAFQVWQNGRKMREGGIAPATMLDNAWWKVTFSPIMVGMGDSLTFRLFNCDTEVNLGFYVCKDQSIGRARIKSDKVRSIAMKLEAKVG
jgi:hypothetical protein